jgi:hypothetical protein
MPDHVNKIPIVSFIGVEGRTPPHVLKMYHQFGSWLRGSGRECFTEEEHDVQWQLWLKRNNHKDPHKDCTTVGPVDPADYS